MKGINFKVKYVSIILIFCMIILSCGSPTCLAEEQKPIRIGIVDSGISSSAEINYIKGYNYISNTDDTEDDIGHGTALAGIVSWISPDADIVPLKITGKSFLTTKEITAKAIYESVDLFQCDILLLSFGQPDTEELHKAIKYAAGKGVIMISAVGNEGFIRYKKNKVYYPAGYDEVIGVGSSDVKGDRSFFSQINNSVFIVSNGEKLKSSNIDGRERLVTGTSFSAASIAGLAANMRVENDYQFKKSLKTNAIDKGDIGFDNCYGWGFIQIGNLLEEGKNE